MEIVILLYKGFTTLDAIGPYEVLSRLPDATVKFAATTKGIIESEFASMSMVATHSLKEIESADILIIPGSTTAFLNLAKDAETLHNIQRIDATTQWTISICSGAIILAAAGLLQGKTATTHWAALEMLSKFGAIPVSERYVQQGKIITAAGVSAGIDVALYLTQIIAGDAYAKMIQLVIEYYPAPPTGIADLSAVPKNVANAARELLKKEMMKMMAMPAAIN